MTKKNLIINLEATLDMKKDDLKKAKESLRNAFKQEDEFEVGYNTGLIFELESEIDNLERLLSEVK